MISKIYKKFNTTRPCMYCGCRETNHITRDRVDYTEVEYELNCKQCDKQYNYWSYGHFEFPNGRLDYVRFMWIGYCFVNIKEFLKHILFSFEVIFRKSKPFKQ